MPAATAVVAALVFFCASKFLIDDTFITLSYARNLAFDGNWGLISGYQSNTATSPMNVLSLAAVTVVVRDTVLACGIVFVLSCVAAVTAFRRIADHFELSTAFAPVALTLIVVNPVVSSSLGLEVVLGTAVLSWVAVFAVTHAPIALGIAAGAAVVTRVDLVLVVAALVLVRAHPLHRLWLTGLAAAFTALPWFLWSWIFLGSAVPDTVVIKTGQEAWGEWGFGDGLGLYLDIYPAAAILAIVVPVLGGLCLLATPLVRAWRRVTVLYAWGIGGVAYYAAYTFLDVPPYHWYYGLPAVAGTVVFVGAVFASSTPFRLIGVVVMAAVGVASTALWAWSAMADRVVPLTTNHATPDQYETVGSQLVSYSNGRPVRTANEIGAIAFYCECAVVDRFSDRAALAPDLKAKMSEDGVSGWLWRTNFSFLDTEALAERGPIPLAYRLERMTSGEGVPEAVVRWPITSPWTGVGELYLVPEISPAR